MPGPKQPNLPPAPHALSPWAAQCTAWASRGSNPSSTSCWLYDLRSVILPLCASFSHPPSRVIGYWRHSEVKFWPRFHSKQLALWFNLSLMISCCSVTQSCPTPHDPVDCSMLGLPVLHYLLECARTHVH